MMWPKFKARRLENSVYKDSLGTTRVHWLQCGKCCLRVWANLHDFAGHMLWIYRKAERMAWRSDVVDEVRCSSRMNWQQFLPWSCEGRWWPIFYGRFVSIQQVQSCISSMKPSQSKHSSCHRCRGWFACQASDFHFNVKCHCSSRYKVWIKQW